MPHLRMNPSQKLSSEQSITCPRGFVDYILRQRQVDLPAIPKTCVISHSQAILDLASAAYPRQTIDIGARRPVDIYFFGENQAPDFAMVACPLGAPMAAVLLEELIALGFEQFVAIGIAGHPAGTSGPSLALGELVLVDSALIYEGTSRHYDPADELAHPDPALTTELQTVLEQHALKFTRGRVATTDAFYRETESFIEKILEQGVIAIDMEMSALFTVSRFRGRRLASLVYISDVVQAGSDQWEMAFIEKPLCQTEEQIFIALIDFLRVP